MNFKKLISPQKIYFFIQTAIENSVFAAALFLGFKLFLEYLFLGKLSLVLYVFLLALFLYFIYLIRSRINTHKNRQLGKFIKNNSYFMFENIAVYFAHVSFVYFLIVLTNKVIKGLLLVGSDFPIVMEFALLTDFSAEILSKILVTVLSMISLILIFGSFSYVLLKLFGGKAKKRLVKNILTVSLISVVSLILYILGLMAFAYGTESLYSWSERMLQNPDSFYYSLIRSLTGVPVLILAKILFVSPPYLSWFTKKNRR
jgi:hypothetical protein